MSDLPFRRREFLKAGAGGTLFTGLISQTAIAESVAEGPTVYVGSRDNTLYAVDAATGTEEWAFTQPSSWVRSPPTVVDGTVYVGGDETLYAVDAATGTEEWAFTQPSWRVFSSPTVVDGTVYVGSLDSTLYAVDAVTGTEEWAFQTSGAVFSSPTVVDGTVYVGSLHSTLYAVDAVTGTEEWAFTQPSWRVYSSPTVVDGTVYAGGDETLYAVDAATGTEEWAFTQPSDQIRSPTVVDGTVYVGSHDSTLYAVDAATGTEEWAFQTSGAVWSSSTVVDGTVYVGSSGTFDNDQEDSALYAVDAATGTEEWAFTQPSGPFRSPTVVDGTVYVGSSDNTLYAVDAATGTEEWAFQTSNQIRSSPTVVADPQNGDSIDSRVNLGTLGHTDAFAEQGPTEPGLPDDPEPEALITGTVTDSTGQTLEDVEVRAQNQETDEVVVTDTDANGAFEMEVEPEREYRVLIFDQFGLEQTEFEKFVELDEEETRELGIELLSKFEIFEAQKLGSDEIAGLAPRIDDLSTPLIAEEDTVESEIQAIEAAMNNGDIDRELAEESLERMVLGEAMVNRTLEAVTDSTPINLAGYDWSQGPLIFEDEMPDFDLLFQTSKGIVIGILESFYSIKKIAKEAAGDLADKVIDAIVSAIGNFIRDLLSDFQTVLDTADRALTIGEMLVDIEDAADEALDRLEDGATFDNVRSVVEDLADPIADQIANSILAAIELLSIEGQLDDLNTALSANSVTQDPQFANDIVTLADDTRTELQDIETQVEQAEAQMNPESDALEELINLAGELADAGFSDILGLLASIRTIVEDLVDVISSGFNIGFGIVRTRQIYTDSAAVVNDITETV